MAEIKIEKKKKVWPWVLAGLGIVILVIAVMVSRDTSKPMDIEAATEYVPQPEKPADLLGVKENNATVAAYVDFIENSPGKMTLDHAFSNEALLKLIEATKAMAGIAGYTIQADLEKVKGYANIITKEKYVTTHADYIRIADDTLAHELQNIQMAKYPTMASDIEELKRAAEAIDPNVKTLKQKDAVRMYFAKACEVLKKMN